MQERRKLTRSRVLKSGKMLLSKSSVIDCLARDLTKAGAGLEVANTYGLPDTLDLSLGSSQPRRRCRLVWRKLNKTGVEFL